MKRLALYGFCLFFAGCDDDPVSLDATVNPPDGATATCGFDAGSVPESIATPRPHTPRWAFEPWISKDISDTADTYAFVEGFRTRDIPVGVVVLDSPWETHYNTFVPSPTRYPEFGRLVNDLHARNIRVVLWVTQFVNQVSYDLERGGDTYRGPSPNFEEGRLCGFYVNRGETYGWWKGRGASVDFFNPAATAWWHRQQDPLLAVGIDGWKLDFGDNYVTTPTVETYRGPVPHQQYSEAYYHDYYAYGVHRRGPEFLTMVRPWDESYQFAGRFFARREDAPVAWVGDNRRDRAGLLDALDHIFRSARAGYVVVGSDLGGYLDFDDRNVTSPVPFELDTFQRWIALSALTPFMQLHGRANLAPWTVPERPDETVAIYRYWAKLHRALVPFHYALAEEAWARGGSILEPQGEPSEWPGDYRFVVGRALLVAPLLDATGRRDVRLPSGSRWYDWWAPASPPREGGTTVTGYDATQPLRIPLFVREGAIVPLNVEDDANGLGTRASAGALTVLLYPGSTRSEFTLHEGSATARIELSRTVESGRAVTSVALTGAFTPVILRVRAESAPSSVSLDGAALAARASREELDGSPSGYWHDPASAAVWVRLPPGSGARTVALTGP